MKKWSTQLAWSLFHILEPPQGYSSHGSLRLIAPSSSSTCVVLLSLISDSFTIPFSPIWGGSVPFAVGFQDPLGHRSKRGKGQAATGAQAPEQGWVSSWEPLLCRLSRRTDTSMENSSENAPWWNSSHHGLWWSGCSSKPFSHNLCCFAPGWAGAVCNLGWN